MSNTLKSPFLAKIVAVLDGFTAFAALGGAGAALPEAVNKTAILEPLRSLPWSAFFFSDMIWPRIFLVAIIGLPQVLALVLTALRRPRAWLAVTVSGGILLAGDGRPGITARHSRGKPRPQSCSAVKDRRCDSG